MKGGDNMNNQQFVNVVIPVVGKALLGCAIDHCNPQLGVVYHSYTLSTAHNELELMLSGSGLYNSAYKCMYC